VLELNSIRTKLASVKQDHLLRFFDELSSDGKQALLTQIASLDLDAVPSLIETYVKNKPALQLDLATLEPATYYPYNHRAPSRPWDRDKYTAIGEDIIRKGEIAAFVVAGGQGSRLGFDGPKGCFPAGCITQKPLFQLFAEQLLAARARYGIHHVRVGPGSTLVNAGIPWYIMTSPLNHKATVAFFEKHSYFGLSPTSVRFFQQGVLPSFDLATGKILLSSKGEVATNPDGHGGAIRALDLSGALDDMKARGVKHISYFQVDNPHVRIVDPTFIGLHAAAPDSSAQMSSKMLPKVAPDEKLGVFCSMQRQGRRVLDVIEYSDMPADLSAQRLPDGSLRFVAGSIAIHMLSVAMVEKLARNPAFSLPYHRAEKKVPFIDLDSGQPVSPTTNNAVKLERFVFDAIPLCEGSIVYETDRVEEFAPIKNASGTDSVESSKRLQTIRAARWLERCGVAIPKDAAGEPHCVLEISPLTATSADELKGAKLPAAIERGSAVVL